MQKVVNIWLDDVRPPKKEGYQWTRSVRETIKLILAAEFDNKTIGTLDLDHDLGKYAKDGGDGIEVLNWLEEHNRNYSIALHTYNPVGKQNMKRIIFHNGWRLVK